MLRKMVLAVVLGALAALSLASAASAVLEANGTALATGTSIGTTSGTDGIVGSATLVSDNGLGSSVCAVGGIAGTISTNPGGAGSTSTGSLSAGSAGLSFTNCTTWFGASYCWQTTTGSFSATSPSLVIKNAVMTCYNSSGQPLCSFATGSTGVAGAYDNTNHQVAFSNVPLLVTSGGLLCGTGAHYTATYGPIEVLSGPLTGALVTLT